MSVKKNDNLMFKLEAVLFSYARWVGVGELKEVLKISSTQIIKILGELQKKYEFGFAFQVEKNLEGQWRMSLKSEFESLVEGILSGVEIPKPILKVLSVIAYEQPITKTGLNRIMGRSILEELGFLYKNKYINYDKKGIGKYYHVTRKFYEYFKIEGREEFLKKANETMNSNLEKELVSNEE